MTSAANPSNRLQAEVRAAYDRGWRFTPLRGKIPILRGWHKLPPADLGTVLGWVDAGHNIGLRTGSVSGVAVLDIDKGGDIASLDLPPTPTVITPGGGFHLYFSIPDGLKIRNSVGKIGPHIDVRGEGGQVVFVGSTHPNGGVYQWMA